MRLCLAALLFAPCSLAATYLGSQSCASCHPAQFRKHSASRHAHALSPLASSPLAAHLLDPGYSPDGKLRYESAPDGIVVHGGAPPDRLILQWAFGAGAQGITPVGKLGSQYIEHRFSYYSRPQRLAPTFGHPPRAATPLSELGVLQDARTIYTCFHCHATNVEFTPSGPDLDHMLSGVQCERCHGPGSSHVTAAQNNAPATALRREIVNPGRMPAKAVIEICGQCHRLPSPDTASDSVAEPELENPVTVRFAPIGLLASACFRQSNKLSCITCHNPHEDARPANDAGYTEKCLSCHAADIHPVKLCRRRTKENCLPCHMQQASLGPYLRFTDHRIRVY